MRALIIKKFNFKKKYKIKFITASSDTYDNYKNLTRDQREAVLLAVWTCCRARNARTAASYHVDVKLTISVTSKTLTRVV